MELLTPGRNPWVQAKIVQGNKKAVASKRLHRSKALECSSDYETSTKMTQEAYDFNEWKKV